MNENTRRVKCVVRIEYYADVEVPTDINTDIKASSFLSNVKRKVANYLLSHVKGKASIVSMELDPEVPASVHQKYNYSGLPLVEIKHYYKDEEITVGHPDIREIPVSKY